MTIRIAGLSRGAPADVGAPRTAVDMLRSGVAGEPGSLVHRLPDEAPAP